MHINTNGLPISEFFTEIIQNYSKHYGAQTVEVVAVKKVEPNMEKRVRASQHILTKADIVFGLEEHVFEPNTMSVLKNRFGPEGERW